MDKSNPTPEHAAPGISIRNGIIDEMVVDKRESNNAQTDLVASGKRKARHSTDKGKVYKEASSAEDDGVPLVCRVRSTSICETQPG